MTKTINTTNMASWENARLTIPVEAYLKHKEILDGMENQGNGSEREGGEMTKTTERPTIAGMYLGILFRIELDKFLYSCGFSLPDNSKRANLLKKGFLAGWKARGMVLKEGGEK